MNLHPRAPWGKMSEEAEEIVPDDEGDTEEVEEEIEEEDEEADEVPPEESSDSVPAAEAEESYEERLAASLELPLEVLEAVGQTEQGKLLLEKVIEHFEEKDGQIEDYQATLNDFTQSMNQQHGEQVGVH